MSEKSQKQQTPKLDMQGLESLSRAQGDAIKGMIGATGVLLEGMADCSREWMGFIAGRVRTNLDTQRDLYSCRSFTDVVALQSGFVQTAVEEYSVQSTEMMKLGSEIVKNDLNAIVHLGSAPGCTNKQRSGRVKQDIEKAA